MITEKQLLEWGFKKEQTLLGIIYTFAISTCSRNRITIHNEYVEVDIERKEVSVAYAHNYIHLANCTSKRKADQATHLIGLPSIDKLNTIKK